MNTYDLDTTVLITTGFTMTDNVTPIDPTAVFLFIQSPDGIVTSYTGGQIDHPSTGNFTMELQTDQSGPYIYKWQGTGAVDITSPDQYFLVQKSAVLVG